MEACLPKNASPVQRSEMEKAFYSGYGKAFAFMTYQVTDLSDEDAEKKLTEIETELTDYFELLAWSGGVPKN